MPMESVSCRFHGLAWFSSWTSPHPAHAIAIAEQGAIGGEQSQPLVGGLAHQQAIEDAVIRAS
jgi:hypothetical protein